MPQSEPIKASICSCVIVFGSSLMDLSKYMIPSSITTGVSSLNAALAAMGSYLSASVTIRRALLQQAATLATAIDTAEKTAAGALDTFQGSIMPGDTVNGLLGLLTSAQDEQTLSDLRGVIGRMVLNIEITG